VIAIDDGSVDDSARILETCVAACEGRLKVVTHPGRQRRGIAASYRLGLEHCRGGYIAFLEQDDMWPMHKRTEKVSIFTTFPEVGVVLSEVYMCDTAGRISARSYNSLVNSPPTERPFRAFWQLLWGNCVCTFSNFMVRAHQIHPDDIIAEPAGFQDWMLLLVLSRRCQFYCCHSTQTFWRQRPESYFAQLSQLPKFRSTRKLALRQALEKLCADRAGSVYPLYTGPGARLYWDAVIALLSAIERTAHWVRHSLGVQLAGR